MRNREVILLALAYFCYITNSVGLGSWLPKIVQRLQSIILLSP
jgi:fucose permease